MHPEKRDKIINSVLEEFSKNDYAKASTNNIVKNANISKGLLYHYFGTKKNLYETLKHFVMETTIKDVQEKTNWENRDIFERIKEVTFIKFQISHRYPYIFDFAGIVFQNHSVEDIKKMVEDFSPSLYEQIFTLNIDFSLFKERVDVQKSINIIRWTLERFSEETRARMMALHQTIDFKQIENEMDAYLEILKESFYK